MLTFHDGKPGLNRRQFLTVGSLGLGGLTLSSLLGARARAAEDSKILTGKSVVFLYQQGGPSQFETFDPKLDAPDTIRTVTGTVPTRLAGVRFGDTMARLARLADKFTVIRSFQTNNGAHNIHGLVSPETLNANIGSLYSRVAGAIRPESGMPTNYVLFNHAACTDVTKGSARGDISATGNLGSVYAPFLPGSGGDLQKNMQVRLPRARFDDRRALLAQLDRLQRDLDARGQFDAMDEIQKQAYQVLLSNRVTTALDLSKEDPRTLAEYDTNAYVRKDDWASKAKRGTRGYYTGHARALGKLLLLARRLCEAGAGFVSVHAGYEGVWDMHADGNNLNMKDGMEAVGLPFDHAVSAFIEDLEARGLRDKILLVCTGEMGRTPRINKNGGRDHWSRLAPLLLYGGGIQPGKIIGQSTKDGGEPAADNQNTTNLVSTVLHTVFDVGNLRLVPGFAPLAKLAEVPPIPGVF
jgi:hypothetical protein